MSRWRLRIVTQCHLQSGCPGHHIITTGMDFWFLLHQLIAQYRKTFLHFYIQIYYITLIFKHWQDTWVKDFCTNLCDADVIGHILQMMFTRLSKIVANAHAKAVRKAKTPSTFIPRNGVIGICRFGHPGTTFEKSERPTVRTAHSRSLHEFE